ncbi:MAG: T9SS type A sorting domain-containing protein [Candidatus Marinimicrobia bacterium]|nr:T9SS type A sorting domain-containing protein [Candidatus Neomarinimicrobiota bacterium]
MNFKKSIIWVVSSTLLLVSVISAEVIRGDRDAGKNVPSRLARFADSGPSSTFFNINSWKIQMRNEGFFDWNGTSHGSTGNYPKGMGSVIFAEGIIWGAKVTDKYGVKSDGSILTDGSGGGTPRIRVNGSMYNTGLKAGKVLLDANGKIKTSGYSENHRTQQIWRVRRNFVTGDLRGDAAILRDIAAEDVTDAQMDADRAQYQHDWDEWPADEGAPYDDVNGDGSYTPATWDEENKEWGSGDIPGIKGADQTVWTVANDLPDEFTENGIPFSISEGAWGSPPIGFEMQLTLWGYDFPFSNPLSSMMFKRARMIYVGLPGGPDDAKLDTVYFTQWSDPDLGTYTDDYVGCDTTLSLGYVYNGNTFDDQFFSSYGSAVPAGGYDFLEGPKVDADGDGDLDTLGMTSYVYFAAGSSVSDPNTKVYIGSLQWFNLMEGFLPRPEYPTQQPFVDPITGLGEIFVMAGDPVKGTGWIDGMILPPGDRRLVMNTGPFQMALGDTQDVVVGLIGGMGGDNLSSITVLKYHDIFAQFAYDNNFSLPSPPPAPEVSVFEGDGYITLNWAETSAYGKTESSNNKGFKFEGYKIYQLPNALAAGSDGVLIDQYDVANSVLVITEKEVDPTTGLILEKPAHVGSDNGISRVLVIKNDALRNRPITNDRPYYFGISAYSYLEDHEFSPFKSLESPMAVVSVIPKLANPGTAYTVDSGDYFDMDHSAGTSDGQGRVEVIDPGVVTGQNYKITFEEDTVSGSPTEGSLLWNVTNSTTGSQLLTGYKQGSTYGDPGFPAVDGLTFKVTGPPNAFKNFLVTANADGSCTEEVPCQGSQDWGGFPTSYTGRSNQASGDGWFFHGGGSSSGGYDTMIGRIIRGSGWKYLIPNDFEYRFTYEDDNYCYLAYTSWSLIRVPFEIWNITDGYRLCPWSYDYDGSESWGLVPYDSPGSGGSNDPFTDWIYPRLPVDMSAGEAGYQAWLAASIAAGVASGGPATPNADGHYLTGATGADYWEPGSYGPELMGRNVWFVWNLDDVADGSIDVDAARLMPDNGFVLKIVTNKTNQLADEFTVTAPSVASTNVADDVKKINVFPNPYMGYHDLEGTDSVIPLPKYVTFNHLPTTGKVIFRVFNIAGTQVASFEKNTTSQYQKWNMRNSNEFPLASGVYIVHIDMPDIGATKVLKLAIVTEEEFAKAY